MNYQHAQILRVLIIVACYYWENVESKRLLEERKREIEALKRLFGKG
jgi:hypothetical protein